MTIYTRPDEVIFASGAKQGEIVTFPDLVRGWGVTLDTTNGIPPMEFFNFTGNRLDKAINYLLQTGVPEHSAITEYPKGAIVQSAGQLYIALQQNTAKEPQWDTANWANLTPPASTSKSGVVKLSSSIDSTSQDQAATPFSVKKTYDFANTKISKSAIRNDLNSDSEITVLSSKGAKELQDHINNNWNKFKVILSYESVDLNDYITDGIYCFPSKVGVKNKPKSTGTGNLFVVAGTGQDWCQQVFYEHYTARTFLRFRQNESSNPWSGWIEQINSMSIENFFPNLKSQSGWQKLPNGMIFQWGKNGSNEFYETVREVQFPIQFPNLCCTISVTSQDNSKVLGNHYRNSEGADPGYNESMTVGHVYTNSFEVWQDNNVGTGIFYWFAIGY